MAGGSEGEAEARGNAGSQCEENAHRCNITRDGKELLKVRSIVARVA